MKLKQQITSTLISTLKSKDKEKLSTLRLIQAAILDKEKSSGSELDDAAVLQILDKMRKQRLDAASQFAKAGRSDLEKKENDEIVVISEFMPEQLSDNEIEAEVKLAIKELGASSPKDMGKVISSLRSKLQGKADFSIVSKIVKSALQN